MYKVFGAIEIVDFSPLLRHPVQKALVFLLRCNNNKTNVKNQ